MKTLLTTLTLALLLQVNPNTQTTTTQLAWDWEAAPSVVATYTQVVRVDGTNITALTPPSCVAKTGVPTQTTCTVNAPTLATGTHTVEIDATVSGNRTIYTFTGLDPSKGVSNITGTVSLTIRKTIPIP